jgi:hypothetical protein
VRIKPPAGLAVIAIVLGAASLVLPVPIRAAITLAAGIFVPWVVLAVGLRGRLSLEVAGALGLSGALILAYWCLASFVALATGLGHSKVESLVLLVVVNACAALAPARTASRHGA